MGIVKHEAIIVTSWNESIIAEAHDKAAVMFGGLVSPLMMSSVNSYRTFLISPGGSKIGWEDAIEHDAKVEKYCKWLDGLAYDDGSTAIKSVRVRYGEMDRGEYPEVVSWDGSNKIPKRAGK